MKIKILARNIEIRQSFNTDMNDYHEAIVECNDQESIAEFLFHADELEIELLEQYRRFIFYYAYLKNKETVIERNGKIVIRIEFVFKEMKGNEIIQ